MLGVLAGINRVYFTPFQLKRTGALVEKLSIAPERKAERLQSLFESSPELVVAELKKLVSETVEIVEARMLSIDTSPVRKGLVREYSPWKIE